MTEQEIKKVRDAFDVMVTPSRFGTPEYQKDYSLTNAQNIFDEDYLRVLVAPAFRRMQDKAQVFPLETSDFVRTRLTHSLEVSHFGYLLGVKVENLLFEKNLISETVYNSHAIPSILRVAGLIHDIGNTPFGHFGEQSMQTYYRALSSRSDIENVRLAFNTLTHQEQCDLFNFDGNVQGLRVVTKLASAKHTLSLHLSKPVISTMIKYPSSSLQGRKNQYDILSQSKFGYFKEEDNIYHKLNKSLGLSNRQHHPLTYLLEAADDIAYSVSDIEDGFFMKTLTIEDIMKAFKAHHLTTLLNHYNTYENGRQDVFVQILRLKIQERMVADCASFYVEHFAQMVLNKYEGGAILESSQSSELREATKDMARFNFDDKRVLKREILGGEIITDLLDLFLQAIFDPKLVDNGVKLNTKSKAYKVYSLISNSFKYVQCRTTQDVIPHTAYGKFLLVNDFISGMTDSYALHLYKELIIGDVV